MITFFKHSARLFFVTLLFQIGSTSCEQNTCDQLIFCANDGSFNSEFCSCTCIGFWEGTDCTDCTIDSTHCSGNKVANTSTCQCNCPPNFCGPNCDQPSFNCANGGVFIQDSCKCNCLAGWTGDSCTVNALNQARYYFELVKKDINGVETILDTVQYSDPTGQTWAPQIQSTPPSFATNFNDWNLNVDWYFPIVTGNAVVFTDFESRMFDISSTSNNSYTVIEGTIQITEVGGSVLVCGYNFTLLNDAPSITDTFFVRNGEVVYRQ